MTALSGPILFNATTGNDGTSSGCGPSVAVTETITTTAASNSATVTSGSGYSVGDLMYIPSATGRKFNVIATISGTTITFDNVWDDSLTSVSAYIGGKRATWDNAHSRELFTTNFHTAVLDKIKTETDQTLTSAIAIGRHWRNPFVIYADEQKTISTTGDFSCFTTGQNRHGSFYNLKFLCGTTSTKAAITAGNVNVSHCQFGEDGSANNWKYGIQGQAYGHQCMSHRCKFYGKGETVSGGFAHGGTHYNSQGHWMTECFVKDYETGFRGYPKSNICNGNIITACKYGAHAHLNMGECANNIFNDISSDCITFANPTPEYFQQQLFQLGSNIFSNVSGHLITSNRTDFYLGDSTDNKNLYTHPSLPTLYSYNSSNTFNNMPSFPVQTLSVSPFVDAANGDFNLNATNGGGGTLRSTNYTLGG